jgi:small subunit ribosomal protein S17
MSETEKETTETTEETPAAPETADDAAAETAAVEAEAPALAEEPTAEADATAPSDAPAEAEAPSASAEPKRKKKRLARSQRPVKTRPKRETSTERKPIVRGQQAEPEKGRRQERRGVVVSDAMDKTIVVKVESIRSHPRYKKVIRRSAKFHAHDEQNAAHVGDVVRIVETRPLSKTKNWRLAEIVEVAK